ncbi:efflux RND transporter permease subunit [Aliifodinibius sp. S!AR15-10]|uniref:efflux RND transporter permease subunit n=1 Tax=Aliifodinibius sp. S!AR15-10 TaxID=2950437 RepID=UPI0028565D4B|nr:efflux RND transporter permease subunit [Aliifodinibius sp. S!AR15-10]MDR8391802.1 efflux RND transporter permease subunit [Aliifodinibius sp. S!AR15-10]
MHATELSLRRPITTIMVFISFVVIGIIASRLVPLEYFPDISFPGAYISVPYQNSTPKEIERNITRPIEEAIATISGLEEISSTSSENQAGIFVRFKMGTDIGLKAMEVKEKIDGIRNQLPDDMERFYINKFSAQDNPMLNLRISSERDLSDAYDLLDRNLKQRIERINGVAKVDLYGVDKKQIRIELIPDRLEALNVNIGELANTLRETNFSVTAGKIQDAGKRFMVRPIGEITETEEFENLVIGPNNLRLGDIAEINYESPEREYGRHLDQKYAIGLDVFKESGANTVSVSNLVMAEIDQINQLPKMRGINIYEMHNQASGIISSLLDLLNAGLLGGLFSIMVLYLFLRQISTTLIVALAVPFSLIVTLGLLYFLDLSLNILSMMGLMLAIGMLVDNAVVVTENIHRNQNLMPDRGKATVLGVKQVALAVTAGTFTSIIVFLPNIVSETSMIAIQMYHVAISIIIALLASLFISLTIIPLLTSHIKPPERSKKSRFIDQMISWYGGMLHWLMNRRYLSVAMILGTLVSVAIPLNIVKVDMFPPQASRELYLQYNLNDSYTLERVEQAVDRVEKYLYDNKNKFEIESVYSFFEPNYAQSTIILTEDDSAEKDVMMIRDEIATNLPKISIGSPSFDYNDQSGGEQLRVYVIGESSEVLEELSGEVIRRLEIEEGIADVRSEAEAGSEEVQLVVDRERARSYGLSTQQIASMVSNSMRGINLRRVRGKEGEIDVVLAFRDADRQSISDLMSLPVNVAGDQTVKLASLADYEVNNGPQAIQRQDRQTSLGIVVNLDDITTDEARATIANVLDQINYPTGYGWSYGRSFQEDQEAMDEMIINMLMAMVLIYLVMASLFESVLFPSSIITSIFYGIIGVFWFFFLTSTTFSFMAMIGILILMGIVVNNGIVLIDHITQLRNEGMSREEAIIKGGKDRMRPILMTAGTTILGLLPLCFGNTQIGGDGPAYFPMARAIVGGLAFSTVITLVILPSIYIILDDIKRWGQRILSAAR